MSIHHHDELILFIMNTNKLKKIATTIRLDIVEMLTEAGSGHLGGSLGLTDIFTFLYFEAMNHRPHNPKWEDRDKLILSIGHVAPVLYATLANSGYFDRSELKTLRKFQSHLQGHPSLESGLPGIETSSGSLGQGLGIAVGMALANKMDKKNSRIYCIMGDGELQEGSVWESAMSAAHYQLNNITAIVDRNNCQIDGKTSSVMNIEPLADKWKSFGWHVEKCDGHDFMALSKSHQQCLQISNKPSVIIATTKMGKGIPEIEDNYMWHGKVPNAEQCKKFKEILANS